MWSKNVKQSYVFERFVNAGTESFWDKCWARIQGLHAMQEGLLEERIIRVDDFLAMIDTLQPNPRLRKLR